MFLQKYELTNLALECNIKQIQKWLNKNKLGGSSKNNHSLFLSQSAMRDDKIMREQEMSRTVEREVWKWEGAEQGKLSS